ncbi:MAG TPA: cytochrome c oxidase subunit 3 [bacterium]|nr:cytochrome c oxidase subunit 3 [bacterium]
MIAQAAARPGGARPAPLVLGMVLFIASETMFFGALFGAYFTLRSEAARWPPAGVHLDLLEMGIATAILLGSSIPAHLAEQAIHAGQFGPAVRRLVLTSAMGLAFLGLKLHDWATAGFTVASHAYGTIFFTLTGFHALHMVVGIILLLGLAVKVGAGTYRPGDPRARTGGPEAVIYYWHFVDGVWIAVFSTIWLIR